MKIAFIGLGNMGSRMVRHLIAAFDGADDQISVLDLDEDRVADAVQAGAHPARGVRECVTDKEIVITMLPASHDVESAYCDTAEPIVTHASEGALLIDCSTISAAVSKRVAIRASERGLDFVDAPVSGGIGGAEAGTLTFMIGGEQHALARAEPVLEKMGSNLFHAGEIGSGQIAKACNNLVLAAQMSATSEAIALGVRAGLDPGILSAIMQRSSAGNWVLNGYNPYPGVMDNAPAAQEYANGFAVDLMIKDLGLALSSAEETGASTPVTALVHSLYRLLRQQKSAGQLDFSSIQKLYLDPD